MALVWWGIQRGTFPVLLAVAMAFGCVHIWQTRESPGARLAAALGEGRLLRSLEGRVVDDPTPYGTKRFRFLLRTVKGLDDAPRIGEGVLFAVIAPEPPPGRGDLVAVTGSVGVVPAPRNPGEFNARQWMALRGVRCEVEVAAPADLRILKPAGELSLARIATTSRQWMEATLREGIQSDAVVSNLLAGMVLGVTSAIPDDLQEQFRNTGTFHLFSVSGLHVGMIAVILWQALLVAGTGRRVAVAVIIPAVFFYALVTGWKPSSVRAATMTAIFLLSLVAARHPVPINSLCAAGFLILAGWTNEFFNPGFQLSFLVVMAILLLSGPLSRWMNERLRPDPFLPERLWNRREKAGAWCGEYVGSSAAVSVAAWLGSLPLILIYFHLVSFSALVANLAIVPLAFLIMATALVALAGGAVSGFLAAVFNNANWLFTKALLVVVQVSSALPGSHFNVAWPERADAVVTVFDLGAGGAAAIESPGSLWFFDTGSAFSYRSVLRPWLQSRARTLPDGILISHGDARHAGGGIEMLAEGRRLVVGDSPADDRSPTRARLHADLEKRGLPKMFLRAGDRFSPARGMSFEILFPPAGWQRKEADDKTLVVRLHIGGVRLLFLSDAGLPTQQWLLENAGGALAADVLVTGRHRSGFLPDQDFLRAVSPSLVVATVASFPGNEPMDEVWAEGVRKAGIRLFRQDESGAVRLEIRQGRISAKSYLSGATFEAPARITPVRYEPSHR
jgi:ComEC/Rec2-related protein